MRKIDRLLEMDFTEITFRSRQEAWKWIDRVRAPGKASGSPHLIRELAIPLEMTELGEEIRHGALNGAAHRLQSRFQEIVPDRFFAGAEAAETARLLRERMPSHCEEIVALADSVCQKRFDLLGYRGLDFGDPIDWHLDPVAGRRAPFVHWSRLAPLDPGMVGDSKIVWELNRHQWLLHLGQAYRFTGEEKYAETFSALIRDWIAKNPPGMGINWASSLEAAFRIISWSWALFLFRRSAALTPELFLEMLGGICAHAGHVEKYLSTYFAPNTHLTGEALALFYAGLIYPELQSAERWRSLGMKILTEQSERQVLPDGVYF